MTRTRYTMSARSQGKTYAQRAMAENDARGLSAPRDAVKALIKATGLSPHTDMCGWPFCLDDIDNMEGGAM